jgi:predicted amidohydrolase
MRIAAVQMISSPDVAPNLATAGRLIAEAAAAGAQLVALPEYFPLIGATDIDRLAARETDGRTDPGFSRRRREETRHLAGRWLDSAAGAGPPQAAQRLPGLRPAGQPCRALRQDPSVRLSQGRRGLRRGSHHRARRPGSGLRLPAWPCWHKHLLRPALPRAISRAWANATCWCCPPPSPKPPGAPTGKYCCAPVPSRTSAIVLAAAQGGRHPNGRMTHGNSMVIDPWGEVLARMDKGEGVVLAELDPQRLVETRSSLPALKHRIL